MKKKKLDPTFIPPRRPPEIEEIRAMARWPDQQPNPETDDEQGEDDDDDTDDYDNPPQPYTEGAFISKPADQWLDDCWDQPDAKMLFDRFWYEGELCILFADTNIGKSVLAVQLGDSISRAEPVGGFTIETAPQPVVYFDFELTAKQFQSRYTDAASGNFKFGNFSRAVINPDDSRARKFDSYYDYLCNGIENLIVVDNPAVLIIDNITCLRTSTFAVSSALSLMKNLQRIKCQYNLSILVLAHTPKRNAAYSITGNDLQGSKMLLNFCDSAFAIGQSRTDPTLRYLKQIKQRNTAEVYGENNVCLCRMVKPGNFLKFEFKGFDSEINHLQKLTEQYRRYAEEKIAQLTLSGMSCRKIATELSLSTTTVHRTLKKLQQV